MNAKPCRTCAHVEQIVVWTKSRTGPQQQRTERCIHPAGPKPMHEWCGWHQSKNEGAKG